jgi:hypothetical protein
MIADLPPMNPRPLILFSRKGIYAFIEHAFLYIDKVFKHT